MMEGLVGLLAALLAGFVQGLALVAEDGSLAITEIERRGVCAILMSHAPPHPGEPRRRLEGPVARVAQLSGEGSDLSGLQAGHDEDQLSGSRVLNRHRS